jgi:quercetin dioxygenase-like cupin family protein
MIMNRRDCFVALSAFAAAAVSSNAEGQIASPLAKTSPVETVLSQQRVFPFDQLQATKNANGEARPVLRGVLPTGEAVEMHETTLLPGHMPHPPHKHRHSEFMLVREGTVEFDNDGTLQPVGPGGVIFAASNVMHGLKNIAQTNANYFVIAIGRESPANR